MSDTTIRALIAEGNALAARVAEDRQAIISATAACLSTGVVPKEAEDSSTACEQSAMRTEPWPPGSRGWSRANHPHERHGRSGF